MGERPTKRDTAAVSMERVAFGYEGPLALEDVTFSIPKRAFISVIGPNGGGKSTLLKLMLGLVRPNAGRVAVFGETPVKARRRIGYVPQYASFDPQFPVTVNEVALMGRLERRWAGPYSREDRRVALAALEEMDMAQHAGRLFADLSGGERQRVLIARALACEPELLLLDEPTANVDAVVGTRLLEILRRLKERMTILMVSHDLTFASEQVDSAVCVNRRVAMHPTAEITPEILKEVYGTEIRLIQHSHDHEGASHG